MLGRVSLWVLIGPGLLVIFVPMLLTAYLSVFDEKLILFPPRGYTLGWYGAIWPNFGDAVAITIELAIASVLGSLILGVPAGIALSRYRLRGTGIVVLVETETAWPLTGSLFGLVLAHLLVTTPWVVRLSLAALTNHDRTAEEAATSLGWERDPRWRRFVRR
jgi:putative spermidine/putrescine transport system permease protein